jgi:hypothetical protein
MVSVEFRSVGPGTCSWCRKEKSEVFTVAFGDRSFDRPTELCLNDLRCWIRLKLAGPDKKEADRPAPPAGGKA